MDGLYTNCRRTQTASGLVTSVGVTCPRHSSMPWMSSTGYVGGLLPWQPGQLRGAHPATYYARGILLHTVYCDLCAALGKVVPIDAMRMFQQTWQALRQDPSFWDEFRSYYQYIGRPSACHVAPRMTEHAGRKMVRCWPHGEEFAG